jgi:hypothetical protein
MKTLITILLLLLPMSAFADGVNKKRVHKSRPKVTKPAPKLPVKTPKQPSLLESKYDLIATPTFRPLQPLFDIPVVPPMPIVETEIREFPFEHKSRKGLLILLGGAITGTAVAILLHDSDQPVVVPQIVPTTTPVPESPAWMLLAIGLVMIGRKVNK